MKNCPQWLKDMPKTDLHCHLGGSIRLKTLLELGDKYGIKLPSYKEEELKKFVIFKDRPVKSLSSYLDGIKICESVFVKAESFSRVAYELCQDAAEENVKIMEVRFAPTNYESEELQLNEIVEATLDGLTRAARDFKILNGLIICGIKTDMDATRKAAEIAINYQDQGVVGFDMAGKEKGYRPKQFRDLITPVLYNFLPVTIHAGEDDSVASVAEALIYLNARRIGHGITIRESSKLLNYINKSRIGIEICMTSNVDTGAVHSYQTHPIRSYFKRDLRLSINTDNRLCSDTNITKEYMHLLDHTGFTRPDIFRLAKDGIKSAFLDTKTMKTILKDFDEYIENIKPEVEAEN